MPINRHNFDPRQSPPRRANVFGSRDADIRVVRDSALVFRTSGDAGGIFIADEYERAFEPQSPPYSITGLRLRYFNGDDANRLLVTNPVGVVVLDFPFAALIERAQVLLLAWEPNVPWVIKSARPTNAELIAFGKKAVPF